MIWPGEEQAWQILSDLDAGEVAVNAGARFDPCRSTYWLTSFGQEIAVSLRDRALSSGSRAGVLLINDLGDYSRLAILQYLIHAKDRPCSGRLVRPADLPGGDIFIKGTHILPLVKVAAYFSGHHREFLEVGRSLGGGQHHYGDLSLHLFPFPRVPVVLILWLGDDEFPATASLLLDSGCAAVLPIDVIWSIAMVTVGMVLLNSGARHSQTPVQGG